MIRGAPTCICMPGFEETDQGCYPAQHGKMFSRYNRVAKETADYRIFIEKLLLQYPVTRRITVRLTAFAVLTEIGRSTFACVCPVTSVSGELKKKSLPTVNNFKKNFENIKKYPVKYIHK